MSIACEVPPQGNYAVFSKGQNDPADVQFIASHEWQRRLLGRIALAGRGPVEVRLAWHPETAGRWSLRAAAQCDNDGHFG
jgi:hypothetical protein